MRWFDEPPCLQLDVKESTPTRLFLTGPTTRARLEGGATAAVGSTFAGMGLRFLRLPIPGPFKLVPLVFTAAGAGLTALGATTALASASLEVTRAGLTLRWKVPTRDERALELPAERLEALEVTAHAHSERSTFGGLAREVYQYRLVAVTKDGRATPLEWFPTRAQAELRQKAVTAVLRG